MIFEKEDLVWNLDCESLFFKVYKEENGARPKISNLNDLTETYSKYLVEALKSFELTL